MVWWRLVFRLNNHIISTMSTNTASEDRRLLERFCRENGVNMTRNDDKSVTLYKHGRSILFIPKQKKYKTDKGTSDLYFNVTSRAMKFFEMI